MHFELVFFYPYGREWERRRERDEVNLVHFNCVHTDNGQTDICSSRFNFTRINWPVCVIFSCVFPNVVEVLTDLMQRTY